MATGKVNVSLNGNVIIAEYIGEMTEELLVDACNRIIAQIKKGGECILYETMRMNKPNMRLAMIMKKFDSKVGSHLTASATVTSNSTTAFMSKLAFIFTPNHQVFYNNVEEAKKWLNDMSSNHAQAI